jgi:uncharacterized FlgJ-related protein
MEASDILWGILCHFESRAIFPDRKRYIFPEYRTQTNSSFEADFYEYSTGNPRKKRFKISVEEVK